MKKKTHFGELLGATPATKRGGGRSARLSARGRKRDGSSYSWNQVSKKERHLRVWPRVKKNRNRSRSLSSDRITIRRKMSSRGGYVPVTVSPTSLQAKCKLNNEDSRQKGDLRSQAFGRNWAVHLPPGGRPSVEYFSFETKMAPAF